LCGKKKNFSYFKNKYFLIFLIFWVYLIFNSLVNNFNLDSLKISFFYIRFGIFVIAVTTLLEFDPKFIKLFFYCIFACFICLIIDGYYQYFKGENIFGFKAPSQFRVSSFFNDEMILGSYLSRIWPIFFALSIFFNKQKNNFFILFIIIFISSEALIFLSGDRTAFFFINISAIFVIMLSQKLYKLRLFTLCFSFLLLIIISLINPNAKERVINETLNQMNLVNKDFDKNIENNSDSLIKKKKIYIFSEQHTHHYITAYKMFLDNKILGVGVKNFRNFCNEDKYSENELSCANHPHSTYFQLLSETGIIGFFFYYLYFFIFVRLF
jgi:O-antigen ligase